MKYLTIILYAIGILDIIFLVAYIFSARPALPLLHILSKTKSIEPDNWLGTPFDRKGRFVNCKDPFYQNYITILKWLPSHALNLICNWGHRFESIRHTDDSFLEERDTLIWLGHASFYLNLNGIKILVDPHFYNTLPYIRHTPAPIPGRLFTKIDFLLMTHDHSDHFNKKSLKQLFKKNPNIHVLTGDNMEGLIQSCSKQPLKITTALWHERYTLNNKPEIKIHFIPTRHYSKRLFNKYNKRLWGGFIIKYKTNKGIEQTILLGGDSGYGDHYTDIKNLYHPDIAILGIGAYMPEWFMNPNHMSPTESLKAFDDTGASILIPMHYGTFNLSNENMKKPFDALMAEAGKRQIVSRKPGEEFRLT